MTDRTLYRWGSVAAVVGGVLALVGNAIHPRILDRDDGGGALEAISGSAAWTPIHLGILVATLLIVFALFAVARSLKGGAGEGAARIALGALVVSAPVAIVTLVVDGYALKQVADAWAGASGPAREAVQVAGTVASHIEWSFLMAFAMSVLGIVPAVFGWAIALDGDYPSVLGWPAVAVGLVSVVAGVVGFLGGPSGVFFLLFLPSSALLTLWVVAVGVVLGRRARSAAPAGRPAPTAA